MNKCFTGLIFSALLALISLPVNAITPTPEQMKMFRQLPPAQQKIIMDSANKQSGGRIQKSLTQPRLVEPRPARDGGRATVTDMRVSDVNKKKDVTDLKEDQQQKVIDKRLKSFGYDLFAGTPTTFAPATDIPIPADYVVGPGDTIQIQLFGKDNEQYSIVISREGILNFPELGPISVVGQKFSELKKDLKQRIAEQMIGVKASITMGELRSIRIFVLGDAYRPGSYTVSSLSTMTNALFLSGGVQTIGSLRNIQLKRRGKVVSRLDLYDLLLRGDTSGDTRLLPGDVIFIPPIGTTVGVGGEVRRPAIYELKNEKTTSQIIKMAGGLLPTAYPKASQLERINTNQEKTLIELDLNTQSGNAISVQNGDVLRIYSVLEKMEDIVLLSGNVERPGGQEWRKGMKLTDVIPSIKYLLPGSDLNYVLIRREIKATRRIKVVSTDLEKAFADPASRYNLELQPRDEVIVFSLKKNRSERIEAILDELKLQATNDHPVQEVNVGGRVHSPGEYPLEEGMRVSDLIRAAGKLMESAYVLDAEITRYKTVKEEYRQAEHVKVDIEAILAGDKTADLELKSHDYLIIKDVPRWAENETIKILGEVKFPGTYTIIRGETLSAVMRRAGGVSDLAFIEGAVFMRKGLREREQKQMDALAERLESDIAAANLESTKSSTKSANTQQATVLGKSLVSQLRSTKAAGRLVIDLHKILKSNVDTIDNNQENTLLALTNGDILAKDGDILVIPKKSQSVTVLGEVHFPTSHIYKDPLSRDDYVGRSGGITYKADKDRIYVVRANGEVIASNDSFWSFDDSSVEMKPGDTIIVPLDASRIETLTLWTSVTQIIYQVGVAVAAFNSAGIF